MSTLTRTNSHNGKKPQYKDYVTFLDGYRGGKKSEPGGIVASDSGVNFSLNGSSNHSSNSVFSDVSDDNFHNHKYNASALPPTSKPKQTVKTEMFIEIKSPPAATQSYPAQIFEVHRVDNTSSSQESSISVSSAAKMFENKDQTDDAQNNRLKAKQNNFKKNSIGEISRKFEGPSPTSVTAGRPPVRRAASIGEVSKIFENTTNIQQHQQNTLRRPKNFNAVPKPFQPSSSLLPKINTEVTTAPTKPAILSPKPVIVNPSVFPKFIPDPPRSYADSVDSALSSLSVSPSPPQCVSPPPGGPMSPPPPPPPLPPANFSSKSAPSYKPSSHGLASQQIPVLVTNTNGNTTPNGTLDRNDPRVKKAVYGALRNMYGAYHDQANDYLATLPKNRVKKNNGLDRIIDSIAQARLPCVGADFGHILPTNGHQPTVKLKPKVTNNKMDPPQCVQNAMMTKDKKPFTYTPGGIDLSEVRSPRMQRRIERNANLGGADDMPKPPPPNHPQHVGPLPPATLAAMRPQPQVQVFPGPPPPPPMQKHIPPPPPPPACALPTQKVTTGDNQVLERPDMTKIIPENPMSLLRKTGGPSPRKSPVDMMYEEQSRAPPSPPQRNIEAQSPRYQPPVVERPTPVSPPAQQQRQPQVYQPPPQQYQPPTPPQNQQYQPSYQQPSQVQPTQYQPQYQPVQVQQRSTDSPKPAAYQPPIIERQASTHRHEPAQKNVTSSVGSLYIPPLSQQHQKVASPPTPPERNEPQVQSPGTPTLKEAPRPWQQRNVQQQPEVPAWAKKDEAESVQSQSPPSGPNMQQRWQAQPQSQPAPPQQPVRQQPLGQQFSPRSPQVQQQSPRSPQAQNQSHPSNSFPVHIEIRTVPHQQEPEPSERKPNAVYITQPLVLQHPGPGIEPPYKGGPAKPQAPQPQYQQPRQQVQPPHKVDSSGARIIPIQIERTPPTTPAGDRNLTRQLSWGCQPTQSNAFKVIQKFTKTDDDEDDDTPVTQHSARFPQEMPEQMRKMKVNDNGHFRQEVYQYDEENPRYRGGYIPSKIFKYLDESVPQQNNGGRPVPVQLEGNGQPQQYVHPSEQVVPEPKKYMGSNIPSRSFKILQAMTAPSDNCANANNIEEISPYNPVFNPYSYPYYPPPYWSDYYTNYYHQEQSEPPKNSGKSKSGRSTPLPSQASPYHQPHWYGYYPNNYPQEQSDSTSKLSDRSSIDQSRNSDRASTKSGRSTPLSQAQPYHQPYWHDYYPNNYPQEQSDSTSKMSDNSSKSGRSSSLSTPVPIAPPMPPPYWGYMPPPPPYRRPQSTTPKSENTLRPQTPKTPNDQNTDEPYQYPIYPPYYDPYYYSYYYGYPPMMPHYPYYHPSAAENEEYSGYSSMDEMSNYNGNRRGSLKRRNSLENSNNSVQLLRQQFEVRSKSATPRITITPTYSQENIGFNIPPDRAKEDEDSDTEVEEDDVPANQGSNLCRLRSIKSVQNINMYANTGEGANDSDSSSASEDSSEEETDEEEMCVEGNEEEIIPHQLSVIFEESERGDSRRSYRCNSVASEATTIAEHHSEEEVDEDFLANQNVRYKINMFQETNERISTKSSGNRTIRMYEEEQESYASFSFRSNSMASQRRSHAYDDNDSTVTVEEIESDNNCSMEDVSEQLCIEAKEDCDNTYKNIKDALKERAEQKIDVEEKSKQGYNDWWDTIERERDERNEMAGRIETSIIKAEGKCDSVKLKAESVMVEVEEQVVCVKLRNRSERSRKLVQEESRNERTIILNAEKSGKVDDSLFSFSVAQRDSVYDVLKTTDEGEEEVLSGGTLMRVDSFASQLEAIKRNSGLWNIGETNLNKPNHIIKEESFDSETTDKEDEVEQEIEDIYVEDEEETITVMSEESIVKLEKAEEIERTSVSSEEVDFWSQIKNDDDDFLPRKKNYLVNEEEEENCVESLMSYNIGNAEQQCSEKDNNDSTNSSDSSYSKSHEEEDTVVLVRNCTSNEENETFHHKYQNNTNDLMHQDVEQIAGDSEEESESDSSEEVKEEVQMVNREEQDTNRKSNSRSRSLEPQTIKERIEALRNSIAQKQEKLPDKEEVTVSVKSKISAIEVPSESRSKTVSTKSSMKSFEEYSEEEEMDSGVISDISRHISDNEEFPELKKLTRYERAATHSRLFKLLQDECDIDEQEEEEQENKKVFIQKDKFSELSVRRRSENKLTQSRSKLSLPLLSKCTETDIAEAPQINEKLVEELVQSLLRSKKAQVFKNMPREKLYAAAVTILQEGIESGETPSEEFSSLLSPLRGDTESSTPAQTPQEFYGDYSEYKQYYDSWSDAAVEITPSKAFKLLQEHLDSNKLGNIEGILAKCPRILSSKNIPKDILKLLQESSDCSPNPSQNIPYPHSNEVTNT